MNHDLRHAIEARNPRAVAEAMASLRHAALQSDALLEVLNESTALDLKHIQRWAEDWLSDPARAALRSRGDAHWQAMTSVYQLTRAVLRTAGITRGADGAAT